MKAIKLLLTYLLMLLLTATSVYGESWRVETNGNGTVTIRRPYLSEIGGSSTITGGPKYVRNDARIVIYGKEYYNYVSIGGTYYSCVDRSKIVQALIKLRKGNPVEYKEKIKPINPKLLKDPKKPKVTTLTSSLRTPPRKLKP